MWCSPSKKLSLVYSDGVLPIEIEQTLIKDFGLRSTCETASPEHFKVAIVQNPFQFHLTCWGIARPPQIEVIEKHVSTFNESRKWPEGIDYLVRLEHLTEDLRYLYLLYHQTPRDFSVKRVELPYFSKSTREAIVKDFRRDFEELNYPTTLWYRPEPLINGARFDLGAKLIYASSRMRNLKTTWPLELYKKHILTFNGGWEWPGGLKNTVDEFVASFNHLIDHFDQKKAGVIPVSDDGVLANGAHRTTVAYLRKVPLQVEIQEKERRPYGYQFFQNRLSYGVPEGTPKANLYALIPKLDSIYTDEMALEFCRRCPQLRVVTLLPKAQGKDQEVTELLKARGDIIYYLRLKVSLQGLDNLVKEFYRDEPWIGGFFSPGSMGKTKQCWNPQNPYLRVYLFSPEGPDFDQTCRKLKEEIRDLYRVENHSVHINDTQEETLRIAGLLLNPNSRHFLEHSKPLSSSNQQMFKKYFEATKDLEGDYCISGSFVLAAYGLRESRDLDYICHGNSSGVSLHDSHNQYAHFFNTTLDDIIYNPTNHFYFAGRKVASLQVIRAMKKKRGEPKDHRDRQLIDQFLGTQGPPPRSNVKVKPGASFDIHQITFYKNGLRLENFLEHNQLTCGMVNFFEASDTTINFEQSLAEGLETQTYNPNIPRFVDMAKRCPGKIGCNLSHYYLYLHLLERSPCRWHLILEDDVEMTGGRENRLFETIEKLIGQIEESATKTHYIKLITFDEFVSKQFVPELKIPGVDGLYKKIFDWGTGAQLVSDEGLRILLRNRPWDFIDNTINDIAKQLKCTCYRNHHFIHRGTESGIPFDGNQKYYGSLIYGMQTAKTMQERKIGFPSKRPDVPVHLHGWFDYPQIKAALQKVFAEHQVKTLVELGSWYGKSATFFAKDCGLKVYCVDLWSEEYLKRTRPNSDHSIFEKHPLYPTFIRNMWDLRDKIIPIRMSDDRFFCGLSHSRLPFAPDAFYVDTEHSYDVVSRQLESIGLKFNYPLITGNEYSSDSPGVVKAVQEFAEKNSRLYTLSNVNRCFILATKPLVIKYDGFWAGFNPKQTYLQRLFPRARFVTSGKYDFLYQGDYKPFVSPGWVRHLVVAYSAEVWFKSHPEYTLTITLQNTRGKNLQLRNYERIYFERFGKTTVYSQLPAYRIPKTGFCSFVVKNPNCWQRNIFFDMLTAKTPVDSLGPYRHNVDFEVPARDPLTESHDEYLKILGRYRFCICFENTSQQEYMTEKLYNAMKSGTIPIYWGDPDCVKVYNPKSFIYIPTRATREEQIQEFAKAVERIQYLEDHPQEYRAMLAEPRVLHVGKQNHRVGWVLDQIKKKIWNLCVNNRLACTGN